MKRLIASIDLLFFYIKEVFLANFQVAHDVLTPKHLMNPNFIKVPLTKELSDTQITVLANLITMTPGTLSVEIPEDKSSLFIHAMYLENEEEMIASIQNDYERRVTRVFS